MISRKSEQGITLLIAVVVMAAVSAIAFSTSTIIFNEVRTSVDLQSTEPVLYTTQSYLEMALFKVSKNIGDIGSDKDVLSIDSSRLLGYTTNGGCSGNTAYCSAVPHDDSSVSSSPFNKVSTKSISKSNENDGVINDQVTCTNTTNFCSSINAYQVYNPSNPTWGNAQSAGSLTKAYSRVQITNNGPSGSVDILLCNSFTYTLSDCPKTSVVSLGVNNSVPIYIPDTDWYTIYISTSPSNAPKISLTAYDSASTPVVRGLPLLGALKVLINAFMGSVQRTYQAIIPLSN